MFPKGNIDIHWFPTEIERNFDCPTAQKWLLENWTDSFIYSAIYLVLVFAGRKAMHHRQKLDLRLALTLWSASLAIFSFMGAVRSLTEFVYTYTNYGLRKTMCDKSYLQGPSGLWSWVFVFSKVVELGDTAFIVLRKQKLIFLHWYHHITVMIYVFYSYTDGLPHGRYFVALNYSVHTIMYTYYALKASRLLKIPSYINIIITSLQLVQMVVGLWVNFYIVTYIEAAPDCPIYYTNIYWSFAMYFSYFVLFGQYFYNTYMVSSKKTVKEDTISNGVLRQKEE